MLNLEINFTRVEFAMTESSGLQVEWGSTHASLLSHSMLLAWSSLMSHYYLSGLTRLSACTSVFVCVCMYTLYVHICLGKHMLYMWRQKINILCLPSLHDHRHYYYCMYMLYVHICMWKHTLCTWRPKINILGLSSPYHHHYLCVHVCPHACYVIGSHTAVHIHSTQKEDTFVELAFLCLYVGSRDGS